VTRHRHTQLAHITYLNAHVVATHIDAAVTNMKQARGGYPTTSVGASPPSGTGPHGDDSDVELTRTEANALTLDRAARDLAEFTRRLNTVATDLDRLAAIAERWAMPALDESTVKRRLAAVTADAGLWCTNCTRHGRREPRIEGRTECRFCADFRRDYGLAPPKAIIDIRDARGGRINVQDIERILDRDHKGWRAKRPKPAKVGKETKR